jgi:DNA-binding CsgD family transcriptional regulator
MGFWKQIFTRLGFESSEPRSLTLSADLRRSLQALAEHERLPAQEVAAQLIYNALEERRKMEAGWQNWLALTPREQQITALICLEYTSRQIATRLEISPETVKTHVHNVLVKFNVRRRQALRQMLAGWDFSQWG